MWENQRPALNYYNGYVYFGYGAHGDNGPWHGWLFAYNATTLAQTAMICLRRTVLAPEFGPQAQVCRSTVTHGGRMFVVTGNGTFTTSPPFNASTEFGESVVDFTLANGGITPTDEFTTFNAADAEHSDLDQGLRRLLMVPDQQGAYPHELVQPAKRAGSWC